MPIPETIREAIQKKRKLVIQLKGDPYTRIVEPFTLFKSQNGTVVLEAYQTEGYSRRGKTLGWKAFALNVIALAEMTPATFQARYDFRQAVKKRPAIVFQSKETGIKRVFNSMRRWIGQTSRAPELSAADSARLESLAGSNQTPNSSIDKLRNKKS